MSKSTLLITYGGQIATSFSDATAEVTDANGTAAITGNAISEP